MIDEKVAPRLVVTEIINRVRYVGLYGRPVAWS